MFIFRINSEMVKQENAKDINRDQADGEERQEGETADTSRNDDFIETDHSNEMSSQQQRTENAGVRGRSQNARNGDKRQRTGPILTDIASSGTDKSLHLVDSKFINANVLLYRKGGPRVKPNVPVTDARNIMRSHSVSISPLVNVATVESVFDRSRPYVQPHIADSGLRKFCDLSMTFILANQLTASRMVMSGLIGHESTSETVVNSVMGNDGESVQTTLSTSGDDVSSVIPFYRPFLDQPKRLSHNIARKVYQQLTKPQIPDGSLVMGSNQTGIPTSSNKYSSCEAFNFCNILAEIRTIELIGHISDQREVNCVLKVEIEKLKARLDTTEREVESQVSIIAECDSAVETNTQQYNKYKTDTTQHMENLTLQLEQNIEAQTELREQICNIQIQKDAAMARIVALEYQSKSDKKELKKQRKENLLRRDKMKEAENKIIEAEGRATRAAVVLHKEYNSNTEMMKQQESDFKKEKEKLQQTIRDLTIDDKKKWKDRVAEVEEEKAKVMEALNVELIRRKHQKDSYIQEKAKLHKTIQELTAEMGYRKKNGRGPVEAYQNEQGYTIEQMGMIVEAATKREDDQQQVETEQRKEKVKEVMTCAKTTQQQVIQHDRTDIMQVTVQQYRQAVNQPIIDYLRQLQGKYNVIENHIVTVDHDKELLLMLREEGRLQPCYYDRMMNWFTFRMDRGQELTFENLCDYLGAVDQIFGTSDQDSQSEDSVNIANRPSLTAGPCLSDPAIISYTPCLTAGPCTLNTDKPYVPSEYLIDARMDLINKGAMCTQSYPLAHDTVNKYVNSNNVPVLINKLVTKLTQSTREEMAWRTLFETNDWDGELFNKLLVSGSVTIQQLDTVCIELRGQEEYAERREQLYNYLLCRASLDKKSQIDHELEGMDMSYKMPLRLGDPPWIKRYCGSNGQELKNACLRCEQIGHFSQECVNAVKTNSPIDKIIRNKSIYNACVARNDQLSGKYGTIGMYMAIPVTHDISVQEDSNTSCLLPPQTFYSDNKQKTTVMVATTRTDQSKEHQEPVVVRPQTTDCVQQQMGVQQKKEQNSEGRLTDTSIRMEDNTRENANEQVHQQPQGRQQRTPITERTERGQYKAEMARLNRQIESLNRQKLSTEVLDKTMDSSTPVGRAGSVRCPCQPIIYDNALDDEKESKWSIVRQLIELQGMILRSMEGKQETFKTYVAEQKVPRIRNLKRMCSPDTLELKAPSTQEEAHKLGPARILQLLGMEIAVIMLNKYRRPCYQAPALVDTGAHICLMQYSAYIATRDRDEESEKCLTENLTRCRHDGIIGFGGDVDIMGGAYVNIEVAGIRFVQYFHILPDNEKAPVIVLGNDFLEAMQPNIDYGTKQLVVNGQSTQMGSPRKAYKGPIRVTKQISIQPMQKLDWVEAELICVDDMPRLGTEVLTNLWPGDSSERVGVHVVPTYCDVHLGNQVFISLANTHSTVTVVVPKGTILAEAAESPRSPVPKQCPEHVAEETRVGGKALMYTAQNKEGQKDVYEATKKLERTKTLIVHPKTVILMTQKEDSRTQGTLDQTLPDGGEMRFTEQDVSFSIDHNTQFIGQLQDGSITPSYGPEVMDDVTGTQTQTLIAHPATKLSEIPLSQIDNNLEEEREEEEEEGPVQELPLELSIKIVQCDEVAVNDNPLESSIPVLGDSINNLIMNKVSALRDMCPSIPSDSMPEPSQDTQIIEMTPWRQAKEVQSDRMSGKLYGTLPTLFEVEQIPVTDSSVADTVALKQPDRTGKEQLEDSGTSALREGHFFESSVAPLDLEKGWKLHETSETTPGSPSYFEILDNTQLNGSRRNSTGSNGIPPNPNNDSVNLDPDTVNALREGVTITSNRFTTPVLDRPHEEVSSVSMDDNSTTPSEITTQVAIETDAATGSATLHETIQIGNFDQSLMTSIDPRPHWEPTQIGSTISGNREPSSGSTSMEQQPLQQRRAVQCRQQVVREVVSDRLTTVPNVLNSVDQSGLIDDTRKLSNSSDSSTDTDDLQEVVRQTQSRINSQIPCKPLEDITDPNGPKPPPPDQALLVPTSESSRPLLLPDAWKGVEQVPPPGCLKVCGVIFGPLPKESKYYRLHETKAIREQIKQAILNYTDLKQPMWYRSKAYHTLLDFAIDVEKFNDKFEQMAKNHRMFPTVTISSSSSPGSSPEMRRRSSSIQSKTQLQTFGHSISEMIASPEKQAEFERFCNRPEQQEKQALFLIERNKDWRTRRMEDEIEKKFSAELRGEVYNIWTTPEEKKMAREAFLQAARNQQAKSPPVLRRSIRERTQTTRYTDGSNADQYDMYQLSQQK